MAVDAEFDSVEGDGDEADAWGGLPDDCAFTGGACGREGGTARTGTTGAGFAGDARGAGRDALDGDVVAERESGAT